MLINLKIKKKIFFMFSDLLMNGERESMAVDEENNYKRPTINFFISILLLY